MWITKLRVFKVFQSNLPILKSFNVTSPSSIHLPSNLFPLLCSFSPLPIKCFPICFLQLGTSWIAKYQLKLAISNPDIKNYRVLRPVYSFLSAEELHILKIILISIGKTLFVLVCFDLTLENGVHNLTQYAWLPSFSTWNFSFQPFCFNFAMHYWSLYCPFN